MKFSTMKVLIVALLLAMSTSSLFADFDDKDIKKQLPSLLGSASAGTEFVMTFHPVWETGSEENCVKIYVTSSVATTVTLSIPGLNHSEILNVSPYEVTAFTLNPDMAQMYRKSDREPPLAQQIWTGRACIITANDPIICYGVTRYKYTSDGYLALPIEALGLEYIVSSWNDPTTDNDTQYLTSYTSIISAYDNTEVTFTLAGEKTNYTPGKNRINYGETATETMNKGDVWLIGVNGDYNDLSGSHIQASKQVAVISGSFCAYIPTQCAACDFIIEQDLPMESWGKKYHVTPIKDRKKASYIRVFSGEQNTEVLRNGESWQMLNNQNSNEKNYVSLRATEEEGRIPPVVISSDKQISITQYNTGSVDDGVESDPFQMVLTPVSMYSRNLLFATPGANGDLFFRENFINLCYLAETEMSIPDDILIGKATNGSFTWKKLSNLITLNNIQVIPDPANEPGKIWHVAMIELEDPAAVYSITGNNFMGAYAYGYDYYDSYGFPVGGTDDNVEIADDMAPSVEYEMDCFGKVIGQAIEEPRDNADSRSNFGFMQLIADESYNYQLTWINEDGFELGKTPIIAWELNRVDRKADAKATILFTDRAGNSETVVIEYLHTEIVAAPKTAIWNEVTQDTPKTTKTISIKNPTYGDITVHNIFLLSDDSDRNYDFNGFTINEPISLPFVIASGEELEITVSFDPMSVADDMANGKDEFIDSIGIEANHCSTDDYYIFDEYVAEVRATTYKSEAIIIAEGVDFGNIAINNQTAPKTVAILNKGNSPLFITDVVFAKSFDPSIYKVSILDPYKNPRFEEISKYNPLRIEADGHKDISIQFIPTEEGDFSSSITFVSNSSESSDLHDAILEINATSMEEDSGSIFIPDSPVPNDNDTDISISDVKFSWNEIESAERYHIQIASDASFDNIVVSNEVESNEYLLNILLEYHTDYFWKVMVISEDSGINWSNVWSFQTENTQSVFDHSDKELINVKPNPAVDEITISLEVFNSAKIYNQNGNLIKEAISNKIDVSDFARGTYFIIISTDEGAKYGEFIKE